MPKHRDPHDDLRFRASKRRRERRLREEQRDEWDRFDGLTRTLLQVPKGEIDKKRKEREG